MVMMGNGIINIELYSIEKVLKSGTRKLFL